MNETDPSLPAGQGKEVLGQPGLRVITYDVTFRNGELVEKHTVSDAVVQNPVPTRHISGTFVAALPSRG